VLPYLREWIRGSKLENLHVPRKLLEHHDSSALRPSRS
jgi:hypothetical protein